ncbi:hypothetical protein [Mycobacterium sp. AT1]|uniref:hypothetical protein n=1 Tax=Mycobacterium sp. AT1 TaxID=1961706 RepID=UPI0009AED94C|nr:hypothetical protein [Mycobacterium sp. AT1]OPX06164.1 hypothetical protein B1790_28970 [Mycobacterium sp. AT1]
MDEYDYEWGHATVTYPDWVGTLQLDQKLTGPVDIYDLTGVDRDEWLIIGLDFGGGETGMHTPHVIAVRKSELAERSIYETPNIRAADIQIHGVEPFELLHRITHLLDMRLRIRSVRDATITITELLDVPPQDEHDDIEADDIAPDEPEPETADDPLALAAQVMTRADRLQPKAFERGYNITYKVSGSLGSGETSVAEYVVWRIDQRPENNTGRSFSSAQAVQNYLTELARLPRYRLDLLDSQVREETDGEQPFSVITDARSGKEFFIRITDIEAGTELFMHAEEPPGGSWVLDNP